MPKSNMGNGTKTVDEIAFFVSRGHGQSAANCRVLLREIHRLRTENAQLRQAGAPDPATEKVARIREILGEA